MIDEIAACVHLDTKTMVTSTTDGANGWIALCIVRDTDEVCSALISRLDTFAVICGLLLSVSLGSIFEVPDAVVTELQKGGSYTIIQLTTLTLSIMAHFITIILASLFSSAIRAAGRRVDILRLFLHNDKIPGVVDALFTIGNFLLSIAMGCMLFPVYGLTASISFAAAMIIFCGVAMHVLHKISFLKYSHIIHGWRKKHSHEFELAIPFAVYLGKAKFGLGTGLGTGIGNRSGSIREDLEYCSNRPQ